MAKTANKPAPAANREATPVAAAPAGKAPKVTLDFGSLSVESADAPVRASAGRKATWTPHPMLVDALNASWEGRKVLREYTDKATGRVTTTYVGAGKQIVVGTEDQAKALVTAIRKVAAYLEMGLAAEISNAANGFAVRFAAKTRKQKGQRNS